MMAYWLNKWRKKSAMWLWLAVHQKPHQSCCEKEREILLIGIILFLLCENMMNMRATRDETMNEQNNDKSIDRLWWWCGFYIFFIAFGHVAHIASIPMELVKHKKEQDLRTKWRTATDNSIWIFFLFVVVLLHSIHLSISVRVQCPLSAALPCSWWPSCGHYNEKLSFNKLQSMISACNIRTVFILCTGIRVEIIGCVRFDMVHQHTSKTYFNFQLSHTKMKIKVL